MSNWHRTPVRLVLSLVIVGLAPLPVLADEGMWPYDHAPLDLLQRTYGFTPTAEWLDHLRLSSVSTGSSASFVSPDGLILTNHHVALSSVQRLSTPEHNYVRDGFLAATRDKELPIPGSTARVLMSIEEVTDRVEGAVQPGLDAARAQAAREAAKAALELECLEKTGLKGQVVTLFGGAHYDLYRYKEYTDVRLVFAPELQAAFFGGDWDNFCFPRHDLDFAFLRAYENGKPAHVEHWLQVDPQGAADGEPVFVSGNPGRTERLKTGACLEYDREIYPERIAHLQHQREILLAYSARGSEQARRARTTLYFLGNSLKRAEGELAGLEDKALLAKKSAEENGLRDAVAADPKLQSEYGAAWDRVAGAYVWARKHETDRRYRTEMPGSRFFSTALSMVRYQAEVARPDRDRLPGYHESDLPDVLRRIQSPAPVYKDMEEVLAADDFQRLSDGLGADDLLVQAVLQGRTPADAAAYYLQGTQLEDAALRKSLIQDHGRGVAKSKDLLLLLARRVDPILRGSEKAFRDELYAVEEESGTRIARARFAVYGDKLYPDASGTLRLAFGKVAGYPSATTLVPPFTTWYGLYDRALAFGDLGDFSLTARERERKGALDLEGAMNFACTADITGGNSGSPVVDREGKLVGLAFDGNQTSHANRFVYDEAQARCVCVDVRAILQALAKLYDAPALLEELTAGAK